MPHAARTETVSTSTSRSNKRSDPLVFFCPEKTKTRYAGFWGLCPGDCCSLMGEGPCARCGLVLKLEEALFYIDMEGGGRSIPVAVSNQGPISFLWNGCPPKFATQARPRQLRRDREARPGIRHSPICDFRGSSARREVGVCFANCRGHLKKITITNKSQENSKQIASECLTNGK